MKSTDADLEIRTGVYDRLTSTLGKEWNRSTFPKRDFLGEVVMKTWESS
jgi:hypothetical protein